MQGASRALGSRREGGLLGSGKAAEKAGGPRLRAVSVGALPPPQHSAARGAVSGPGAGAAAAYTPPAGAPPPPPLRLERAASLLRAPSSTRPPRDAPR